MPTVPALVEAVRSAFLLPFAEGLAVERRLFLSLIADERSKALRHVFFAEREVAKVPGIGPEVKPREIARAAVIGAGTMGGGIAMCFANAGIPVTADRDRRRRRSTTASTASPRSTTSRSRGAR